MLVSIEHILHKLANVVYLQESCSKTYLFSRKNQSMCLGLYTVKYV